MNKKKLSDEEISAKSQTELLEKIDTEMDKAKTQFLTYRQKLYDKYGAALKLRTFAVVALERVLFERLFEYYSL